MRHTCLYNTHADDLRCAEAKLLCPSLALIMRAPAKIREIMLKAADHGCMMGETEPSVHTNVMSVDGIGLQNLSISKVHGSNTVRDVQLGA